MYKYICGTKLSMQNKFQVDFIELPVNNSTWHWALHLCSFSINIACAYMIRDLKVCALELVLSYRSEVACYCMEKRKRKAKCRYREN